MICVLLVTLRSVAPAVGRFHYTKLVKGLYLMVPKGTKKLKKVFQGVRAEEYVEEANG